MATLGEGLGTGLGTLLAALLRGREEEQQKRELTRLVNEQQSQKIMAQAPNMTWGNAPPTPMMGKTGQEALPDPASLEGPPPEGFFGTLGHALKKAGGWTLEGLTQGSPELSALEERYKNEGGQLEQARTLSNSLALARGQSGLRREEATFENTLPLGAGKKEELTMKAQQQVADEARALANALRLKQTPGAPQGLNPMEQLEYDALKNDPVLRQEWLQGRASGRTQPPKPTYDHQLLAKATKLSTRRYDRMAGEYERQDLAVMQQATKALNMEARQVGSSMTFEVEQSFDDNNEPVFMIVPRQGGAAMPGPSAGPPPAAGTTAEFIYDANKNLIPKP